MPMHFTCPEPTAPPHAIATPSTCMTFLPFLFCSPVSTPLPPQSPSRPHHPPPPFIIHHHKNFHLIAAGGRNKERKQRGRKNLDVVGFCLLGFDCDGGLSGKTPTWEWKSYLNRNRASRIGGFEGIEQMASWRRVLCVPTTNAPHECACCSAGGTHPWPPMLTPRGAPRQSIEHFPAVAKWLFNWIRR